MIPREEQAANAAKVKTDSKASELLDFDKKRTQRDALKVADRLKKHGPPYHIVMSGAAGSGKTTLSGALSETLGIPVFDLDNYIRGGWTADREEYESRLKTALYDVWTDLPPDKDGWILEHVESCSQMFNELLRPDFAILLDPGVERIKMTAEARNAVGTFDRKREKRALDSRARAREQFFALAAKESERFGDIWLKVL